MPPSFHILGRSHRDLFRPLQPDHSALLQVNRSSFRDGEPPKPSLTPQSNVCPGISSVLKKIEIHDETWPMWQKPRKVLGGEDSPLTQWRDGATSTTHAQWEPCSRCMALGNEGQHKVIWQMLQAELWGEKPPVWPGMTLETRRGLRLCKGQDFTQGKHRINSIQSRGYRVGLHGNRIN